MQTFLPYADFEQSAKTLDYKRLGKQRVEAWQILRTLLGESQGWQHHPAVRMWRGYEGALARYGLIMCHEWASRGYVDNLGQRFKLAMSIESPNPPWLGNENFHRSHRANLVRKNPEHYVPLFGALEEEEYVWPIEK